jgi:hypothetical protein
MCKTEICNHVYTNNTNISKQEIQRNNSLTIVEC